MRITKKDLKGIEKRLETWKSIYFDKSIPLLNKKEQKTWEYEAYLWRDHNNRLMISGGGRILLWLVYCEGGWKKHLAELIRRGHHDNYLESLKFRYREKVLGIDVLKKVNKANYQGLIDD